MTKATPPAAKPPDVRLTPEYITLRRERDRLQRLINAHGLQVKPPSSRLPPTPGHDQLPTDGRTGKTPR